MFMTHAEQFMLVSTEIKGFRGTGAPTKEFGEAYSAGDAFVVDFVRVFDLAR